jgi:16S rRNA (cytosine1402-N4)-methyltransferase
VSNFVHKPVMLAEVLSALNPKPGGRYVDGTIGGAGHAAAILEASSPTGWLYGFDRDGEALGAAQKRLGRFTGRFELRRGNFAEMADWVPPGSCDGVLLDLGVSSPQLDEAERGFSFQQDGPLDMRMDVRQQETAADVVNTATVEELARIFRDLGGEPQARRFARALVRERESRPFVRTGQLAQFIERLSPRRGQRTHPATKVFQAIRITVNREMESLQAGLVAAVGTLRSTGRLAVITFHSLEDRAVKEFGRTRCREYTYPGTVDVPELREPRVPELKWVARKAIKPGDQELRENVRSRSAQLRVLEKT